jgi:hypothetical protein
LLGLSFPLLAARPAQACSCLQPTVESSYNRSSDVIEARVLLSVPVGTERWMVARVRATYKGCLQESELVLLTTPLSSATCGINLRNGQVYLVNGTSAGSALGIDRLSIGLCDYNLPVAELTNHDQAFLDGRQVCCGRVLRSLRQRGLSGAERLQLGRRLRCRPLVPPGRRARHRQRVRALCHGG